MGMAKTKRKRRRKYEGFLVLWMTHKTHRNVSRYLVPHARQACSEDDARQRMATVISNHTQTRYWTYVYVPEDDRELMKVFSTDLRAFGNPDRDDWKPNEMRLVKTFGRLAEVMEERLASVARTKNS